MVAHDDGFPLYKRIPERALHGIVTFFAGLRREWCSQNVGPSVSASALSGLPRDLRPESS